VAPRPRLVLRPTPDAASQLPYPYAAGAVSPREANTEIPDSAAGNRGSEAVAKRGGADPRASLYDCSTPEMSASSLGLSEAPGLYPAGIPPPPARRSPTARAGLSAVHDRLWISSRSAAKRRPQNSHGTSVEVLYDSNAASLRRSISSRPSRVPPSAPGDMLQKKKPWGAIGVCVCVNWRTKRLFFPQGPPLPLTSCSRAPSKAGWRCRQGPAKCSRLL